MGPQEQTYMYHSLVVCIISLDGYLLCQFTPKVTPILQPNQLHILKPIVHNDKFLARVLEFWHTRFRGIGQLMRIRVSRLKEARESPRIAIIHNRVRLLNSIDTVPLSLRSAAVSQPKIPGRGRAKEEERT
jgi:hypothetical protein